MPLRVILDGIVHCEVRVVVDPRFAIQELLPLLGGLDVEFRLGRGDLFIEQFVVGCTRLEGLELFLPLGDGLALLLEQRFGRVDILFHALHFRFKRLVMLEDVADVNHGQTIPGGVGAGGGGGLRGLRRHTTGWHLRGDRQGQQAARQQNGERWLRQSKRESSHGQHSFADAGSSLTWLTTYDRRGRDRGQPGRTHPWVRTRGGIVRRTDTRVKTSLTQPARDAILCDLNGVTYPTGRRKRAGSKDWTGHHATAALRSRVIRYERCARRPTLVCHPTRFDRRPIA